MGSADQRVIALVASIPPGRVTTYGAIADRLDGATARSVGHALKTGGHDVPWWRVVNAGGRPAPGAEQAALVHYRDEGTPLETHGDGTYRVDMASFWPAAEAEQGSRPSGLRARRAGSSRRTAGSRRAADGGGRRA